MGEFVLSYQGGGMGGANSFSFSSIIPLDGNVSEGGATSLAGYSAITADMLTEAVRR